MSSLKSIQCGEVEKKRCQIVGRYGHAFCLVGGWIRPSQQKCERTQIDGIYPTRNTFPTNYVLRVLDSMLKPVNLHPHHGGNKRRESTSKSARLPPSASKATPSLPRSLYPSPVYPPLRRTTCRRCRNSRPSALLGLTTAATMLESHGKKKKKEQNKTAAAENASEECQQSI